MEKLDFNLFRDPVAKQFNDMVSSGLVLVHADISGDSLYTLYLNSYPSKVNGIFRTRKHYDGNYDKNYIRRLGNVIGIDKSGNKHSIWDVVVPSYFQDVANALSQAVKSRPISGFFLTTETQAGSKTTVDNYNSDITWTHFYSVIPTQFVVHKNHIGTKLGQMNTDKSVFERGLKDLTLDAAETVLELINSNSLYKGTEFKQPLVNFIKYKKEYDKVPEELKESYLFFTSAKVGSAVRFRGSVIATLVEDISNGKDLEDAVKAYEFKTAPANYKRTTAIVSSSMIKQAQDKLVELGLLDALDRRFATITDVDVNNVLFTSTTKKTLNVFDDLSKEANSRVSDKTLKNVEEISIDNFINNVLPTAQSLEVLVENKHKNNLMSLITSTHTTAPNMFKWKNNFSWNYNGEVTDSIKETVKKFGGMVDNVDVRISLSWFNADDLDLWLEEPKSGSKITYGNRRQLSRNGGMLDLDMNGLDKHSNSEPVENIVYKSKRSMTPGVYKIGIDQFSRRSTKDVGFVLQIEVDGNITNYSHESAYNENRVMVEMIVDANKNITLRNVYNKLKESEGSTVSKEIWNINTNTFVPVNTVTYSPNHWEGEEGNGAKHVFFMLDACKTDENARGFYNEFLKDELTPHRKVFEVLSARTKATPTDNQLSGIGFNTTTRNDVVVRVKGKTHRTLKVVF